MTVKKHLRAQEVATGQQAALRLPRRLRRRVPADAGRGLPRPRALRPDLLQPGQPLRRGHPADRVGDGVLHRRRRLRPGDVGRDRDRPRPGHDLPRRPAAGEGRDRRGRHRRGARRRRRARPHVRRRRPPRRGRRARAAIVRSIVDTLPGAGSRYTARPRHSGGSSRTRPRRRRGAARGAGDALRRRADRHPHAVRRARGHPPRRRRQPVPRVQAALRRDPGDRLRARLGPPGRHRRQQRHPVQRVGAQGRALHRAVQPARGPAGVPAEHHRLHGRPRVREPRHRPRRRQARDRRRVLGRPEVHRRHRRLVRRRQLRHVRARVRPALPVDVAQRPDLRDGRRAGRLGARDRPPRRHRGARRRVEPTRRRRSRRRSASSTRARARRTTPPPGSGTTASSTPPRPAGCSAWAWPPPRTRRSPSPPTASSGCEHDDDHHPPRRQPRRDRAARHAHRRRLGVHTVAVFTDLDADAPHVHAADEAVRVPSYLDIDAVVAAAVASGADAVHPGYGFLSERAAFAAALEKRRRHAGRTLGRGDGADGSQGRRPRGRGRGRACRVVPDAGEDAGYPVLVKAAAGGGGKGMRIVRSAGEMDEAMAAARREAASAFGDDTMLVEKYVERGRHIEVQVIGDSHGTVLHLFERDCSTQRRHQKVLEEAPAPDDHARGARAASPRRRWPSRSTSATSTPAPSSSCSTTSTGEAYFLEMNTRLQVEHPVTEAVTGLDLVELQLRVAAGEPLGLTQDDIRLDGHAIEARVYAEDSFGGFLPQAGDGEHRALAGRGREGPRRPRPGARSDRVDVVRPDARQGDRPRRRPRGGPARPGRGARRDRGPRAHHQHRVPARARGLRRVPRRHHRHRLARPPRGARARRGRAASAGRLGRRRCWPPPTPATPSRPTASGSAPRPRRRWSSSTATSCVDRAAGERRRGRGPPGQRRRPRARAGRRRPPGARRWSTPSEASSTSSCTVSGTSSSAPTRLDDGGRGRRRLGRRADAGHRARRARRRGRRRGRRARCSASSRR